MLILLASSLLSCLNLLYPLPLCTTCLHLYFCFRCLSLNLGTGRGISGVWQSGWAFNAKEEEDAQAYILPTSQSSMFALESFMITLVVRSFHVKLIGELPVFSR